MLRASVPSLAFKTPFRNRIVLDLAREMLAISQAGLRARAREDAGGMTEEGFLQPLLDLVERGYTRAEELLRRWKTEWNGDLSQLFTEYNFL
jgi:glutamate--cysteine ligase